MIDPFADFGRRKEREALQASLPPYVTAFDARPPDALAFGNDWTRRLFDGDFYVSPPPSATTPACSLVFVQSADGNTGAQNPSSLGGGATDKHLITTSPRPGGDPGTPMCPGPLKGEQIVRKIGTSSEAGVVFAHLATSG